MPNDTNLPKNERSPSVKNTDTHETLWEGLFSTRIDVLLLGVGLLFILCNIGITFFFNTRSNVWLFYLDIRNWSAYTSIALWVTAIWLVSEVTDIMENYRLFIRVLSAICILFIIIFVLWNSIRITSSVLWFGAVAIVICCAVRSFFLLHHYQHEGEDAIDLEEAKWFWGLSGFLCIGLIIFGIMSIIPVKMQIHAGASDFVSMSLLRVCYDGLQDFIRHGRGSSAMLVFGCLFFIGSTIFVYVVGKWILIFWSRLRCE